MIVIEKKIDDLTREVYIFYYHHDKRTIILDSYSLENRETKRHKFRTKKIYSRKGHGSNLKESEVVLPEEIKQQALEKFISRITVRLSRT